MMGTTKRWDAPRWMEPWQKKNWSRKILSGYTEDVYSLPVDISPGSTIVTVEEDHKRWW